MKKIEVPKWMKVKRRYIILVIIALAIGGFAYRHTVTPPSGMTTVKAERRTLAREYTVNGVITAKKKADLKFNLPGKLVWLSVQKGDTVKAYQAVASLDQRLLQKDLANSLSLYMTTRYDFDTTQKDTYEGKVLTDVIRRELGKSQFALDRSVIAVEAADIARREAVLVTPIAGTVVSTNDLVPGINLSGADLEKKTIRVADLTTLYFDARVDEVDYSKVETGQEAAVTLDAYPDTPCIGKVRHVGTEGVESTGGVVTIPLEISLDGCPHTLALGLNGEARIVISRSDNVITIPKKYVTSRDGATYVTVQTGDSFRTREEKKVTIGASSVTDVEITGGVEEGATLLYIPSTI